MLVQTVDSAILVQTIDIAMLVQTIDIAMLVQTTDNAMLVQTTDDAMLVPTTDNGVAYKLLVMEILYILVLQMLVSHSRCMYMVKYPIIEPPNCELSRLAKGFSSAGLCGTVQSNSGERRIPIIEWRRTTIAYRVIYCICEIKLQCFGQCVMKLHMFPLQVSHFSTPLCW
jgi:hypothetical protein